MGMFVHVSHDSPYVFGSDAFTRKNDFIMILRQLISGRGPPKEMWSDRGTNSVGANRELKASITRWNVEKVEIQLQRGIKGISGVLERLIQITTRHLKSAVTDGLLNDIELRTLVAVS